MAKERPPADSIDVRLQWPSSPLDDDGSEPASAPPPATESDDASTPPVEPTHDIYADLAAVRSELSGLRRAMGLVVARDELHELQASINELQGDMSAVLDRRVTGSSKGGELKAIRAELAAIRQLVEGSESLPALEPLVEEVRGLREEVSALRRRIPVRPEKPQMQLSEDQLQRLVLEIGARLDARRRAR